MALKPVEWVSSARTNLRAFPQAVQRELGFATVPRADRRDIPERKPLHGSLRGVLEISENDRSGTYRLVYTVQIGEVVYVLHAFQKKSRHGIATPRAELDLIAQRLREARQDYERQTDR
ncbi:MAG: type II toxin-antitoxin system RelE/ParE family toxin [Candidatus Eremiobacteraeota bacterium]|nr:type II toxin-antitoxin system RelE/ParE family toxin [Candidatus Eremiobacteraeota bacterium]MBC5804206.1 type II toxin-antitoxin system RelE/ParE family toxin [Candidatus Eremiobacteraeota bacterium]MBC5822594.1 type II toxin-antitoxin system RelE/ParE family toxin [Candidatus Eremiobacteraeota bacterium]